MKYGRHLIAGTVVDSLENSMVYFVVNAIECTTELTIESTINFNRITIKNLTRKEKGRNNLTSVCNKSKGYPARPLSQLRKGGEVTKI